MTGSSDDALQRWRELQECFHLASELPSRERVAWLRARVSDPALFEELCALLIVHEAQEELHVELEPSASAAGLPVEHFAGYRLLRVIGSGGMGRVFLAEQDHPQRLVALKLLARSVANPTSLRRFEYESEILARLHHPAIAHVYGSGTVEIAGERLPWFAMEWIAGERTFADLRVGVARATQLELMLQVCDGVAHAHQKGVIHRDLKPANILIDVHGLVKVIDFGIAKLQDGRGDDLTADGQVVGTLQYMSPEQTQGDAGLIDTRSDVYALGVILYELCTRERPYAVAGLGLRAAFDVICTAAPASTPLRDARVPTDLGLIITRALAKAPGDRYPSAVEFAADLRRYMRGEPIEARAPSLVYQLGRFATRHRYLVAAVGLVVLSLGLGIGGSLHGLVRAREAGATAQFERDRAEESAEQAELALADAQSARDFSISILLSADPWQTKGRDTTIREVLDDAAARLDRSSDLRPSTERDARETLAAVYLHLGQPHKAIEQAERALKLATGDEAFIDAGLRLNDTLVHAELTIDHSQRAHELAERNVERHRQRYGNEDARTWTAESTLADTRAATGDLDGARELQLHVAERRREHLGEDHPETLTALAAVAHMHLDRGEVAEAVRGLEEVWSRRSRALGPRHPDTLQTGSAMIHALIESGQLTEAERRVEPLLADTRTTLGERHESTVQLLALHAILLRRLGRFDEALALDSEALAATEQMFGPDHISTLRARNNRGLSLLELGRSDEAIAEFEQLLDIWRERAPDQDASYLYVAINLARGLERVGRESEAMVVLREQLLRSRVDYPSDYWLIELAEVRLAELEGKPITEVSSERVRALTKAGEP